MTRSLGMPSGASVRPVCKPQKKKKKSLASMCLGLVSMFQLIMHKDSVKFGYKFVAIVPLC